MDNWEDFEKNLEIAYNAGGALAEQANVYAESWKAARDRVRASAEDIYDSLINPDFYIDVDNMLSPILNRIADIIDGLGGMQGVLSGLALLMNKVYGGQIAASMQQFAVNLGIINKAENENINALKNKMIQIMRNSQIEGESSSRVAQSLNIRNTALADNMELQMRISSYMDQLTPRQQAILQQEAEELKLIEQQITGYSERAQTRNADSEKYIDNMWRQIDATYQQIEATGQWRDTIQQMQNTLNQRFQNNQIPFKINIQTDEIYETFHQMITTLESMARSSSGLQYIQEQMKQLSSEGKVATQELLNFAKELGLIDQQAQLGTASTNKFFTDVEQGRTIMTNMNLSMNEFRTAFNNAFRASMRDSGNFTEAIRDSESAIRSEEEAAKILADEIEQLNQRMADGSLKARDWAENLVLVGDQIAALSMGLNSINSIFDSFTDEDLSKLEKFSRILSSIVGLVFTLNTVAKGIKQIAPALTATAGAAGAAAGGVAASGAAATGAAGGFATLATSITGVISAIAPYLVMGGLVVGVIANIIKAIDAETQAHIEELEEAQKARQETMEQRYANEELINSYKELLDIYEETGEKKSELDQAAQDMANAYGLEGSALARLSGEQENYNQLLKEAQEARQKELAQQRDDALANVKDSREVLSMSQTGINISSLRHDRSTEILEKYVPSYSYGDIGQWNRYGGDIEHIGEFYDGLVKAREEMEQTLTEDQLDKAVAYDEIVKYIEEMGEKIQAYRDSVSEAMEIQAKLGELTGQTLTDEDISNYKEFKLWIDQITKAFSEAGMSGKEVEDSIDRIVKDSLNSKVKEFNDIRDAIEEVKDLIRDPALDIEQIFNDSKYDPAILATLKWETITKNSFEEVYKSAERYQNALKDIETATQTLSDLEEAEKIIDKAKGDLGIDDWQKVASAIDWGNEEKGIIEFTQFLQMTTAEQQEYMKALTLDTYQTMASAYDQQMEEAAKELERLQTFYKGINAEVVDEANATVTALDNLLEAKKAYDAYSSTGQKEKFDIENYDLDEDRLVELLGDTVSSTTIDGEIFDWEKIVRMGQDELQEALDKAGKDARMTVQLESDTRGFIEEKQEELDDLKLSAEVFLEANFDKQLDALEGYTDDIVAVFDAIGKGVRKSTDDVGNSFYSLTVDAAKAIENMYPGFIAMIEENNGALRDGTYALTQDMYNAFFDSVNGQVAVDAKGKMQMIQNDITMLEGKRARLQAALDLARQIANGEVDAFSLSEEQKELLLEAYVTAEKLANGELLSENSQVLQDINDGYKTVWGQINSYSAQASQNMSDNFSKMTDGTLENLSKIRDGIQAIYLGATTGIVPAFDTEATYTTIEKKPLVLDEGTSSFMRSLAERAKEELQEAGKWDLSETSTWQQKKKQLEEQRKALSMQMGKDAEDNALAQIADINKGIAALSITAQNMKTGITNAMEGVSKANKSGKKKSGKKESTPTEKYYVEELDKELKEIQDRYHEITREIQKQDAILEDIGNNTERTYGVHKLKNYQRELKALQKQQENYNTKLKEATEYWLPRDTQRLKDLFGEDNILIKANGEIANYAKLEQKIIDDYNTDFLAPYNEFMKKYTETTDKDKKNKLEALKAEWEANKKLADKQYEDRQEALSQYEKTRDVIQEQTDALEENARLIQDNKLSQIEYKLEIILDVKSMKDELREFDKKAQEIFGDALTSGTGAMNRLNITDRPLNIAGLSKEQAEAEAYLYQSYAAQFRDLKALYEEANDQTDRNRIIEDIMELQGKVLDSAEAIVEWANSIEDIIPDAVEAAAERYSIFVDQLEHNTTVLDTIKELYALQGITYKTAQGFAKLQNTSQEKLEAQVAQAKLQKKWYDEAAIRLADAQSQLDSLNGDEGDLRYDTYKKARDAYLEEFNAAQEAYLSLAKEAMETAQEMYLEQIDRAVYKFGQKVSGGLGLDLLQDKYDHYIEEDERYFDKVNEAYETLSWYNKLQADIDKATNSSTKEHLKALQKEIDLRRQGGKLSQYDLDILNAKYQVLQAQLALEDAQNAKNSVKLVRDRQGNWNYQYVADPKDIADKEQELLDAQIEWYNLAKEQVNKVTGEIISTWQECEEKIKEIYSDMTLTDQERADRAQEIYEYYTKKIKYLEEEKQVAIKDMTEAGNFNLISNAKIAGEQLADQAGLTAEQVKEISKISWDDILGLVTNGNDKMKELMEDNANLIDIFDNVYAKDLDNMTNNTENFEDALRDALDEAQTHFDDYGDVVQEVAEDTGTTLEDLGDITEQVSDSTDRLTDSGLDAADTLWELISAADDAARSYADLAAQIWETVEALRELAQQQVDYVEAQVGADNYDDIQVKGDRGDDISRYFAEEYVNRQDVLSNAYAQDWADREAKRGPNAVSVSNDALIRLFRRAYAGDTEADRIIREIAADPKKRFHHYTFDTGGYTGEFEGARLAFLHQKELVLNAKDTENILAAVTAIRQIDFSAIGHILDTNVSNMFQGLADRLAAPIVAATTGTTENNYHIDRIEFPNVTSANGLEEAFESLPDEAAQWSQIRKS